MIRQAGCFGLGVWIKKTNLEMVKERYLELEDVLLKCLGYPPDEEEEGRYFYAQDNVATAIGHLIFKDQTHPRAVLLLDSWLEYLPLKRDR